MSPGSGDGGPAWLLLHGSDGRESDLLPLAGRLAPSAATIALRGTVTTPQGFAHVLRRADRTFDEDDVQGRVETMAAVIRSASAVVQSTGPLVVMGFSNGAIAAAALLERCPELFAAGVLIRPEPPFRSAPVGPGAPMPVLVLDGADDARRSPADGRRVAERLRSRSALVTHVVLPVAHGITRADEIAIGAWLHGTGLEPPVR